MRDLTYWIKIVLLSVFCACFIMSIAQEADDEKEAPQQEAQSVASEDRDMEDDEGASAEESSTDEIDEPATNEEDPTDVETPLIFIPTENISEDYAVPFPIDI